MKKQPIKPLTKAQRKAVAAVRPFQARDSAKGLVVVAHAQSAIPLDKHGKPMTRMCPWCSYPMKPFLEGWLRCDHCKATDPVTPDSDRFLSTRVRPPLNPESRAYKAWWSREH